VLLIPPSPTLRDRVDSFFISTNHHGARTVLPRCGAVMGFQLSGRVHAEETPLSTAGITGIQRGPRHYTYEHNTVSVMVRFSAQGACCLGVPADRLAGLGVPLDALLPRARVQELQQKLHDAANTAEHVQLLETFLGALPFLRDPLVERAVHALSRPMGLHGEDAGVALLARQLGMSERQLERRFKARVGLGPRAFAGLRRFERAVDLAQTQPLLTRVAMEAGYYDQPHFNREFRKLAGAAPGKVLRAAR